MFLIFALALPIFTACEVSDKSAEIKAYYTDEFAKSITSKANCESNNFYWLGSECSMFPACAQNGSTPCKDKDTGYIWSPLAINDMSWKSAMSYCDNLTESGFSDWGLPPRDVLNNFYNGSGSSKLGDTGQFWSSAYDDDRAYCYDFKKGNDCGYPYNSYRSKDDTYAVRCVRW